MSFELPESDVVRERMEQRPNQSVTLADFLLFYAEEFNWGSDVVSVRLGKMVPMDSFQKLDFAHYYIPPEEAQLVLHIEDPFEVAC